LDKRILGLLLVTIITVSTLAPAVATQPKVTHLSFPDRQLKHGAAEKLLAVLTDSHGKPLSGKRICFYVNTSVGWHYLGSNITGEDGVAEFEILVTMPNGTYFFMASFNGDSEYLPSKAVAKIIVAEDVAIVPIILAIVKAIAIAIALYAAEEYVLKPYVFTPVANWVKGTDLPYKEYYDDPEELELYFDLALLALDARSLLKNGYKAAVQYAAAKQATGKAIGGHMRWFWYYATKCIADFSNVLTDLVLKGIDDKVYENETKHLTEDEKNQIRDGILPFVRDSNDAYLQKLAYQTFVDAFIVDPIIGYTEKIEVPENVKRMRIYLGWNQSAYTDNFFILKDPSGNVITPNITVIQSTDPEATNVTVELSVLDPISGNWTLWLDGSKLSNETVSMLVQYDKIFEVLPLHVPANPGMVRILRATLTNYGDTVYGAYISFKDVPSGWNVTGPDYCPLVFPNSSSTVNLYVTPPADIRYGATQTIKAVATIDGREYEEPFTIYITPLMEIEDGIAYLHERQFSDGSWRNNVGITSLVLLAYLNAGYDESVEDVRKGIDYILSHAKSDGSICTDPSLATYETSLAILALVATHNSSYNSIIEDAKNWLLNSQWDENCLWGSVNKDSWYYGGFGYGAGKRPDLSNTQFALIALDAAGVSKDDLVWAKVQVFLARCQNRQENVSIPQLNYTVMWNPTYNKYNDGGFVYRPGVSLAGDVYSYGSMTGAGIWCLRLCGVPTDDPRVEAALNWVKNHYTWDGNPGMPDPTSMQYYYYLSMSKALIMTIGLEGQINGHYWYDELVNKLISLRKTDGYWVNTNSRAWENIPELVTAYSVLSMQYRYIPAYIKSLSWITLILHSCADLHLYDPLGRHIGKNYITGEIENQIPESSVEFNETQKITVPKLEAGTYRILVVGTANGEYELEFVAGVGEEIIRKISYSKYISQGETHESKITVVTIYRLSVVIEEPKVNTEITIPAPTGIGNVTFIPSKGIIRELTAINETDLPTGGKPPLLFPFGFFAFKIIAIEPGQSVNVTIIFPQNVPVTSQYWKYQELKGWYQIEVYSNDGDNIIVIQLTDGIEDDDGIANGEIADAGGLGTVSWEYTFEDIKRNTKLRIDLDSKLFHFITYDKDYGIRQAISIRIHGIALIIQHCDEELRLISTAIPKFDFCVAIAWDKQTNVRYFLLDRIGNED